MSENLSDDVVLSRARQLACLEATWELSALARQLPCLTPLDGVSQQHLVIRGIAARMESLANIVMSGIDEPEEDVPTERLRRMLFIPESAL